MSDDQPRELSILTTLRKKRDGEELSREEIEHIVQGLTCGEISAAVEGARLIIERNIRVEAAAPAGLTPLVRRVIKDN